MDDHVLFVDDRITVSGHAVLVGQGISLVGSPEFPADLDLILIATDGRFSRMTY
jgi:hypothetical protein